MRCIVRVYLTVIAVSLLLAVFTVLYANQSSERARRGDKKEEGDWIRHLKYAAKEKEESVASHVEVTKSNHNALPPHGKKSNNLVSSQEMELHKALLMERESHNALLERMAEDVHSLMSHLVHLERKTRLIHIRNELQRPLSDVRKLLVKLKSKLPTDNATNATIKMDSIDRDVCPEKFATVDLSGGYPFFYKGFDMLNCTEAPKLSSIVTLVFNIVKMKSEKKVEMMKKMFREIHSLHSGVPLVLAATEADIGQLKQDVTSRLIKFLPFSDNTADSDIWNAAVESVETKYTVIARGVVHFSWHSRIERIIREINDLGAVVVAGSSRLMSGLWTNGCLQSKLQNFTLSYIEGYDWSQHECIMCDSVQGPFAVLTQFFKKNPLPATMNQVSAFETWFLMHKEAGRLVASCPDSMFFVEEEAKAHKSAWTSLAQYIQVERLLLPSNIEHKFNCSEAKTNCAFTKDQALSHCCMNELSNMIKTFLRLCEESGSLCELQEGTLLGAVKFNGVLPWERDADITFHTNNFSAIVGLETKLKAAGYQLSKGKDPWCCVDGVKAGGTFILSSRTWHAELYGQHLMDSEKLLRENIKPTIIEFDGQRVATPTSPGLFSRNRYGHEIYQHAPHWMTSAHSSGWAFYQPGSFTKCVIPHHHSCLDQYLADGNLHFRSQN